MYPYQTAQASSGGCPGVLLSWAFLVHQAINKNASN